MIDDENKAAKLFECVSEAKQTIDHLKWVASEQPNFSLNNTAQGTNVIVSLISCTTHNTYTIFLANRNHKWVIKLGIFLLD